MRTQGYWPNATLFILASLFLSVPARAANVSVGCPGGSGGTYASINAALNAIGQTGPHTITVTGTCQETVSLSNARSILIAAPTLGGATIVGLQDSDTFDIGLSQDITLQNLEIRGNAASSAGAGVSIFTNSQVNIFACTIHGNPDVGIAADGDSQVAIRNTAIQNNSPGDALDLTNNSSADVAGTTIQNNGFGVFLQTHSSIVFRRQNFILNNGDGAIQAVDLSSVHLQTADPTLVTTIQGHNVNGIAVARQSDLVIGAGIIQSNGSACPTDPTCGGIYALRNSTVRLFAGSITGNQGSGISVEQGVDLVLINASVSQNTGDGINVRRISIGDFTTGGNTVTGNGGASVSCDTTSLLVGDLSTFSNVACKQIERPHGPPRPGNIKHPIS